MKLKTTVDFYICYLILDDLILWDLDISFLSS